MFIYLKNKLNKILNKNSNGSDNFEVYPDDTFIVSYPKSGNTWVRFLIGNYLTNNNFDFLNSGSLIPDLHANPEKCIELKRPRLIKSHSTYNKKYKNVIYIVRDCRDVAVSYYYYHLKYKLISKDTSFSNFINLFNNGSVPFGSWDNHVKNWLEQPVKNFILIKYEDIIKDPEKELTRILNFLQIKVEIDKVKASVKASEFMNMAELEQKQRMNLPRNSKSDPSIPFVRSGKIGDHSSYFNNESINNFNNIHRKILEQLNYL